VVDLQSAVDMLYDAPVEDFMGLRDEQVAAAKAAGDTTLAEEIKALRRPTVGAWLVNLLVRRRRSDVEALLDLAADLRRAPDLDGETLRTLLRQRRDLETGLLAAAAELAADHGQKASHAALAEVRASLGAALADPDAAEVIRAAQLVKPIGYEGISEVGATPAPAGRQAKSTTTPSEPKSKAKATSKSNAAGARSPALVPAPSAAKVRAAKDRLSKAERKAAAAGEAGSEADQRRLDARAQVEETRRDVADLRRFLTNRESDLRMAERNATAAEKAHGAALRKAREADEQLAAARQELADLG
jgi:hypothetical protein